MLQLGRPRQNPTRPLPTLLGLALLLPGAAAGQLRSVDPVSGRPVVAGCAICRSGVPIYARPTQLEPRYRFPPIPSGPALPYGPIFGTSLPDDPIVFESGDPDAALAPGLVPYWNALSPMMDGLGVGTDPGCLRAGGSALFGRADFAWHPIDLSAETLAHRLDSIEDRPAESFPYLSGTPLDALRLSGFRARAVPVRNGLATELDAADFAESLSGTLAGESSSALAGPRGLLASLQASRAATDWLPVPLRATNRDLRDGVTTARGAFFDRDGIPYEPDSPDDLLTLDSALTAEQRALLGCGPFYGTRCDASAPDPEVGFTAGGGPDLRHAELGALVQALPATLGGRIGYRTTRLADAETGSFGLGSDTACLRPAPGDPLADDLGRVRLPGCRGIAAILTPDLARLPAGAPIEFLFERGYTPAVDGCVLGASDPDDPASRGVAIAGHPVVAKRLRPRDDPAFDASDPVGSAEDITALLDATCGGSGEPSVASSTRIGTPRYAAASVFRSVAQTAWHPLAGCGSVAEGPAPSDPVTAADGGLRLEVRKRKGFPGFDTFADLDAAAIFGGGCDFTGRDFEREFLEGRAELFRSEMAAVSWNFLVFLVLTSCDAAGADDPGDPECFDPRPAGLDANGNPVGGAAWAPDRCSLAAPQFCRNVRPLLEATLDDDRDGIPDALQTDASCGPARASPAVLWPPGRRLVPVRIEPTAALAGAQLRVTGVTQDEAPPRKASRWSASARIDGDRVFLDALRAGSGNGRVYRVTYTAERPIAGLCGATATCTGSVEVCVPRSRNSGCHDDGQHHDAAGP
jgi:hypothetical protein